MPPRSRSASARKASLRGSRIKVKPGFWRENIESLLWAGALALIIRTFIMAPFKIPSGSMRPTLIEGDRLLVNKIGLRFGDVQRGDIVVFRFPEDKKRPFIKRLIATGGETVEIRDGKIIINGESIDPESVLHEYTYVNQGGYGSNGAPVTIPEGMYFVLGDNSSSSHDSRFWGFVPEDLLIGKAMCIFWPPNRIRKLR